MHSQGSFSNNDFNSSSLLKGLKNNVNNGDLRITSPILRLYKEEEVFCLKFAKEKVFIT